ncbi:hypothetical protein LguiA_032073 [Lonicera macranthoides]
MGQYHPLWVSRLYLLDAEDYKSREIPGFPLADVNSYYGVNIMCFLDGLICVASDKDLNPVVIYNPLIRGDYIVLPKTEIHNISEAFQSVALGFDPSINKYKTVRMLTIDRSIMPWGEFSIKGQSIGSSTILLYSMGKALVTAVVVEFILEFNVTKEVFGAVSFPPSVRAPKHRVDRKLLAFNLQLHVFEGGTLALMENDGPLLHIWRLVKQNGTRVAGYSSIRIELPYRNAQIRSLLCPTSKEEDLLVLQIDGGFKSAGGGRG